MKAYCLEWHVTKSDAFREMLVKPLAPWLGISLVSWDGASLPEQLKKGEPAVFCQLPPPPEVLAHALDYSITWVPMWDLARLYSRKWWAALPKTVRIVAFSREVQARAEEFGLPFLRLSFFYNPSLFSETVWSNGRVLVYWNRTGLLGPGFLKTICRTLRVDRLIFLSTLDPKISQRMFYELPRKIGRTAVETVPHTGRAEYLATTGAANIFIAPRTSEGVGMSFLEAMAKGAAVFAYNAPTMNEYIDSGRNGFLLASTPPESRVKARLRRAISPYTLSTRLQDWSAIRRLDLERLGRNARADQRAGYEQWRKSLTDYACFLQR